MGVNTSATSDDTIAVKAEPMIMPTARSRTLPLEINSLNSFKIFSLIFLLKLDFYLQYPCLLLRSAVRLRSDVSVDLDNTVFVAFLDDQTEISEIHFVAVLRKTLKMFYY